MIRGSFATQCLRQWKTIVEKLSQIHLLQYLTTFVANHFLPNQATGGRKARPGRGRKARHSNTSKRRAGMPRNPPFAFRLPPL